MVRRRKSTNPKRYLKVLWLFILLAGCAPKREDRIETHIGPGSISKNALDDFLALDVEKDWGFVLFTNSQFGEALGEELFFYLLLGPYGSVIGIVILLAVLIGFGFLIRWAIRKVKNKHRVGFQVKS